MDIYTQLKEIDQLWHIHLATYLSVDIDSR